MGGRGAGRERGQLRNNHNWWGEQPVRSILIQMDILICAKRTKIIATRTSSGLQIWQKCFGGPRWGSLQRSPRHLAGFWEGKMGKRRVRNVRKQGEGRRDKKGEGNRGEEEEGTLLQISFTPTPNIWTLATPLVVAVVVVVPPQQRQLQQQQLLIGEWGEQRYHLELARSPTVSSRSLTNWVC